MLTKEGFHSSGTEILYNGMTGEQLDSSIFNYRMDGLLVSTPTGSTGHSLSLGSSMLSEKLSALLITPIAPISRLPPIAIPISDFSIIAYENARVVVDGQVEFSIEPMEEIKINTKVVKLTVNGSTMNKTIDIKWTIIPPYIKKPIGVVT